jgi:hypothetical protein
MAMRNGFGIAALVLAIIGVVFGLVPFTGFIAFICGAVGLLCGLLGLGRVRKGLANNRGLTITGTALSALAVALGIWGMVILFQATAKLSHDLGALGSPSSSVAGGTNQTGDIAPTLPPGQIGNGTYLVGSDIQPGTYRTAGPAASVMPNCYWSRNQDASGEMKSIIANDNSQGPTTVTIKPSDGVFKTSGCQPWIKVN